jgi:probable F420-dependent oxidoreductase
MKFYYYFPGRWTPINPALMSGKAHKQLAIAAEQLGFEGVCLDEHPAPVEPWISGPSGHHCLDPFVALAMIAGCTSKLRLLTYLTVLAYRNPFVFTKAATTLDVVSDGRAILGVGVGYLKGEFDAVGADFEERNALFEESLEVYRLACTGEPVTYQGLHFRAEGAIMLPQPVQRPHPPLWIGGNSRLSRRRVAQFGQAWLPMPLKRVPGSAHKVPAIETVEDLRVLIDEMLEYADRIGRTEPIEIVMSLRMFPDDEPYPVMRERIEQLASVGVTQVTFNGDGRDLEEALDHLRGYGEEVVARFGG